MGRKNEGEKGEKKGGEEVLEERWSDLNGRFLRRKM